MGQSLDFVKGCFVLPRGECIYCFQSDLQHNTCLENTIIKPKCIQQQEKASLIPPPFPEHILLNDFWFAHLPICAIFLFTNILCVHISETALSPGDTGGSALCASVCLSPVCPPHTGVSFTQGALGHGFGPVSRRHGIRE